MKRTFRDYVEDIITSFEETQEFTQGLDFGCFCQGPQRRSTPWFAVWK